MRTIHHKRAKNVQKKQPKNSENGQNGKKSVKNGGKCDWNPYDMRQWEPAGWSTRTEDRFLPIKFNLGFKEAPTI